MNFLVSQALSVSPDELIAVRKAAEPKHKDSISAGSSSFTPNLSSRSSTEERQKDKDTKEAETSVANYRPEAGEGEEGLPEYTAKSKELPGYSE